MQRHAAAGTTTTAPRPQWSPDAYLDAHPFATWLLELGFDLWLCAAYRRELVLPQGFRIHPGTLVVSNHQRDLDGPMLGTLLVRRRGLRFEWPLPFYATREDLFESGILARLATGWPRPVRACLARIPLGWFFPLGRAEPMRRTREFTLGEALRLLCETGHGDGDDAAMVLNARGRRETGVRPGGLTLRQLLARRDPVLAHWWGLRRLAAPARAAIAAPFRDVVARQLAGFTRRLDDGRSVYFAPEGGISMDGRFGRVRAGCYRLCRLTAEPPWILPVALGYDSLAPGRTRVVMHVGEAFRAAHGAGRRDFDAALRRAILAIEPVTPSHLLARFLRHGPAVFTADELAGWLDRARAALAARQDADPLLARQSGSQLVAQRLGWLRRRRLLVHAGSGYRSVAARNARPGWHHPAGIACYLDNRLADLVPDADRVLPC